MNNTHEGYRICPRCGSLDRHRRLWQILQQNLKLEGRILDFSPSPFIMNRLKVRHGLQYQTSDFCGEFDSDFNFDITNIDLDSKIFDFVICFHVLEHIENDKKAMEELFRICNDGGTLVVQTPFSETGLHEDLQIKSPKVRAQIYGQHDHVRIYDLQTLQNRLIDVGFSVNVLSYSNELDNFNGFKSKEWILICKKPYQKR